MSHLYPHFCGISGLTTNGMGCVYWKGVSIEHYSHNDSGEMIKAACELAAICTLIERRGDEPIWRRVSAVYDQIAGGHGLDVPRHGVLWNLHKDSMPMSFVQLEARDHVELQEEIAAVPTDHLGADHIRRQVVVTQDDFESLMHALRGDVDWASRAHWPAYRLSNFINGVQEQVLRNIDPKSLCTHEQAQKAVLGDLIQEMERTSQEVLAEQDPDSIHKERMRA